MIEAGFEDKFRSMIRISILRLKLINAQFKQKRSYSINDKNLNSEIETYLTQTARKNLARDQ